MTLWMEVTPDKYELSVAVAESAPELAKLRGVRVNNICSAIYHARIRGTRTKYKKVEVDDEESV